MNVPRSKMRKGAKHKTSSKPKSVHFKQRNDEDDGGEASSDEEDQEEGQHGESGSASKEHLDQESQHEQDVTAHAAHSKRMKGKINEQERELIAEKPWALRGEVHSTHRPENRCIHTVQCSVVTHHTSAFSSALNHLIKSSTFLSEVVARSFEVAIDLRAFLLTLIFYSDESRARYRCIGDAIELQWVRFCRWIFAQRRNSNWHRLALITTPAPGTVLSFGLACSPTVF